NRTGHVTFRAERVPRFFGTLELADAEVIATFADGAPAATIHALGAGQTILAAFEFGEPSIRSSDNAAARFLSDRVRAVMPARWSSTVATTYRRRTGTADHYYIINDGPETDCIIHATDRRYSSASLVVPEPGGGAGTAVVDSGGAVTCFVAARSAQWVRAESLSP
ncbi:MAG TPA: hypothetical protein VKA06_03595, partial [Spirochaetia bacterium]|nr:hypothetical protein [Spirochaetia bacterium]